MPMGIGRAVIEQHTRDLLSFTKNDTFTYTFASFVWGVSVGWGQDGKNVGCWNTPGGAVQLAYSLNGGKTFAASAESFGNSQFKGGYNPDNGVFVSAPAGVNFWKSNDLSANPWTDMGRPAGADEAIYKVVYDNGIWLAVGASDGTRGIILRSTEADPSTWTEINTPTAMNTTYRGVAYNPAVSKWMIVTSFANNNIAYSSDNGLTWTQHTISTGELLWDVIALDGKFYVVGENGFIATLENPGVTSSWTRIEPSGYSTIAFRCIVYCNGLLIVAGEHLNNYPVVLASWDLGTTWERVGALSEPWATNESLYGAGTDGRRIFLVGGSSANLRCYQNG